MRETKKEERERKRNLTRNLKMENMERGRAKSDYL
jgi:hypothetical protein